MNPYQIHTKLVQLVRTASRLERRIQSQRGWFVARAVRRIRHAWLLAEVSMLSRRLKSS